jgi:hypothetical protein
MADNVGKIRLTDMEETEKRYRYYRNTHCEKGLKKLKTLI